MVYMNNFLYDILNNVNEGIVILNAKLEVLIWNTYMEQLTEISSSEAVNKSVYEALPSLNKEYFKSSLSNVFLNGFKMFFSAAMHKGLINNKHQLNLKISKINNNNESFLLLEFIDVTNQFARIEQLKEHVNKLHLLNEELKEKEKTIKNLAYYDSLTGLANRTLFYKFSEKFLDNAKRNNSLLGLLFIDVDKFKCINDTHGHKIGDKVLVEVAKILTKCTRKSDLVARFGGDEFLILLPYLKGLEDYKAVALRLAKEDNKILNFDGIQIKLSLSIGVSFYPNDGETIDEIIFKADKAMYVAKNKGGNNVYRCDD